jgi:hypothetical protein
MTVLPQNQYAWLRRCLWPVVAGWVLVTGVHAEEVSREYQLKAAFLFNFAKFVDWPACHINPAEPIRIGVYRKNPFGTVLAKSVAGRKINGHAVVVKEVSTVAAARQMQILFVSGEVDGNVAELTAALADSPVLTVGESAEFSRHGGIITFKLVNDSLRFSINQNTARKAGVKISAQLQKLATKAEEGGQ